MNCLFRRYSMLPLMLAALEISAAPAYVHAEPPLVTRPIGETPAILEHLDQADIESGRIGIRAVISHGALLFDAKFNALDGQGRPAATGNGTPTKRAASNNPGFLRTSGTDANSCSGCHNQPVIGGGGEFVANVFVLAQVRDPVTTSIDGEFSNERNTLGMNGAGAIEMLAREMTADLLAIRSAAAASATASSLPVTQPLTSKGISFGSITALPDGTFDTSGVSGVDANLIIKPFHQKGVVVSLREFSNNAFNHHHGMQSVERFGTTRTGSADFDEDGYTDELTIGDITAVSIYQAALGIPGVVVPVSERRRTAILRGQDKFGDIGCETCHVPALSLQSAVFSEANPYNPAGNLRPQDMQHPVRFNMTEVGVGPLLEKARGGGAVVRAYTDLKRHVICDAEDLFFCNEQLVQGGVPLDQFLTRKLWDVGNSPPYGHRGDLTTITDAILHHAGEARQSREAFAALSQSEQADIVEFLKSLQVLPEGSPRRISERNVSSHVKTIGAALRTSGKRHTAQDR